MTNPMARPEGVGGHGDSTAPGRAGGWGLRRVTPRGAGCRGLRWLRGLPARALERAPACRSGSGLGDSGRRGGRGSPAPPHASGPPATPGLGRCVAASQGQLQLGDLPQRRFELAMFPDRCFDLSREVLRDMDRPGLAAFLERDVGSAAALAAKRSRQGRAAGKPRRVFLPLGGGWPSRGTERREGAGAPLKTAPVFAKIAGLPAGLLADPPVQGGT
jgi:hypothetical protein